MRINLITLPPASIFVQAETKTERRNLLKLARTLRTSGMHGRYNCYIHKNRAEICFPLR